MQHRVTHVEYAFLWSLLQVKLINGEYITSFAGYLKIANDGGGTLINSLTFQTNKRILGPTGREDGEYFCLPSEAGKVTSLFGRTGDYLESIGAQVEPYCPFKSVGLFDVQELSGNIAFTIIDASDFMRLFGSPSASHWDDGNKHANVRKIIIEFEPSKGPHIRSITFQYEEENKELWQSEIHGGIDGNEFHIVREVKVHTVCPHTYLCFLKYLRNLHGLR